MRARKEQRAREQSVPPNMVQQQVEHVEVKQHMRKVEKPNASSEDDDAGSSDEVAVVATAGLRGRRAGVEDLLAGMVEARAMIASSSRPTRPNPSTCFQLEPEDDKEADVDDEDEEEDQDEEGEQVNDEGDEEVSDDEVGDSGDSDAESGVNGSDAGVDQSASESDGEDLPTGYQLRETCKVVKRHNSDIIHFADALLKVPRAHPGES